MIDLHGSSLKLICDIWLPGPILGQCHQCRIIGPFASEEPPTSPSFNWVSKLLFNTVAGSLPRQPCLGRGPYWLSILCRSRPCQWFLLATWNRTLPAPSIPILSLCLFLEGGRSLLITSWRVSFFCFQAIFLCRIQSIFVPHRTPFSGMAQKPPLKGRPPKPSRIHSR